MDCTVIGQWAMLRLDYVLWADVCPSVCYTPMLGMYRQSEKKLVKQQCLLHMSHNMVNFGPLAAEIVLLVWGTPANFNGFRVLAALLHGTLVVGVSRTLRR